MEQIKAIELARDYLRGLPFNEMYKCDPVKIDDKGEYFEIWFERVVASKPLHGLIRVRKESGIPSWVPLR